MTECTYEKKDTTEGSPQQFTITTIETSNHTTTTTIEEQEQIIANLQAKVELHEAHLKEMRKLE